MTDLLSQEEIDALLHGVDDGDVDIKLEMEQLGIELKKFRVEMKQWKEEFKREVQSEDKDKDSLK